MVERDDGRLPDRTAGSPDATPFAPTKRLAILLVIGLAPWAVLSADGYLTAYFAFGWLDVATFTPAPITTYLFQAGGTLPRYVTAYGIGSLVFLLALASAALGLLGREDSRVTAALLVLAGASTCWFALGFLGRPGYVALPVGTPLLWGVVWWQYRPALRRLVGLRSA